MFSGIIEAHAPVVSATQHSDLLRISIKKPSDFNDLKTGDSIAVNGVCLTVESFSEQAIQFALAAETLQVTGWSTQSLLGSHVNLERSLRLGDRIHGHLVSGHVDAMGTVVGLHDLESTRVLRIEIPKAVEPLVWKKGSLTINGVSLTVNKLEQSVVEVCLIPETLARTNLGLLKTKDSVTLEVDTLARALIRYIESRGHGLRLEKED